MIKLKKFENEVGELVYIENVNEVNRNKLYPIRDKESE